MPDVDVYAVGVCFASACAPKDTPRAEIEGAVNRHAPTGLDHGWTVAEESFRTGEANPHPCEKDGEKQHWLLSC